MPVAELEGIEIAYEQLGEGPPLVLAHGAGEDGRAWRPQLEALSDEGRCGRGHGCSR